ncbi:hypothetical protein A2671_01585 [Candidatus Kaiserbacteria bacterium RIFCSPHIGHO2_01_FULL_49_13]|uniref:Thrombospondin type 3 repeat superfamily protein n=1 Tax=Candidatus Kaiserbacteria bacterium RIFCSPHIGHO2_01_FULL_49_13 TaxID=1798477 RepID=A0A1F6CEK5_9BACT|nr:MAG: hypothetical protein A2671_01585 [Candidatus Kaiserbacteria bacterium RIFCSPHIGHO2_01_FULL_49_13]
MNFLLNKKTLLAFLACVALFALSIGILRAPKEESLNLNPERSSGNTTVAAEALMKDSDRDGLKDWEEDLWGTNLENADSDGDGTPDGEEVRKNRNPSIPGPDDSLSSEITKQNEDGDTRTFTDRLAQDVFGNYVTLKQSGVTVDPNTSATIFSAALKNISYPGGKDYAESELIISNETGVVASKRYGNTLGAAVRNYGMADTPDELTILYNALTTNDEKKMNDLSLIVESYQALEKAFAATAVPRDAVSIHLKFLNAISHVGGAIDVMRLAFKDPVAASLGFNEYQTSAVELSNAGETLDRYFISRGISFSAADDGRVLFGTP